MRMDIKKAISAIESMLFASGEPVPAARFCEILELDRATVQKLLESLADRYDENSSGIQLLALGVSWQLATRPENAAYVKALLDISRDMPLSGAAFEVMSIIAYNQPVTKSFIEQVRGIDSSSIVNNLCEKGLIEEAGRLEIPGRPISYRTTPAFLRCFSMASLEELPELGGRSEDEQEPQTEEYSEDFV